MSVSSEATGIVIAPAIAKTVLQRSIKRADRWVVGGVAVFWLAAGLLVASQLWFFVPLLFVAIGLPVVRSQRTTMKYAKAIGLCVDGADCVVDRGRLLRVTSGHEVLELAISPRTESALTLHLLPAARVVRD